MLYSLKGGGPSRGAAHTGLKVGLSGSSVHLLAYDLCRKKTCNSKT